MVVGKDHTRPAILVRSHGNILSNVVRQCVFPGAARAQSDHKQVLALYSARPDAEFSIIGETELPRILEPRSCT
jgi:hypothetical protein